ncbi:hypothetical protein CcaverHIS002_0107940 [Cutaneotrichosporon cavernicola]|uniref:UFSP1/2/DUB catalytic domain-containing protein n=1 Tax=Cutaneotrichosporon cavernicola TaxID=279322 RepID=A0AA48KYZ0_9TREE|nr:uncharacterized protein CcaverHIS019_0107890 [Cutaneotrichosporon cavernicola]BEI80265.1 hypothetical protein CcaverHIS002_0107940 [Cutaneotrichosporon cavernicola]BEI88071.1 hypothetical protein CcaverHIS019_0107890 [Cutaneotrichosporon cavernicola]BEI95842.1 hypothetical protein CcaverHIS631_0107910 [Cutaneotrichosporon cavernicola]BEJ03616.1 hypothetical protein CcaverHIS641_0107910 [Cutaneotrichosporon cavernicola]
MHVCPVCDEGIDASDIAFEAHVNSHFQGGDNPEADDGSDDQDVQYLGETGADDGAVLCFVCGADLTGLSEIQQNAHASACLDRQEDSDHFESQFFYGSDDDRKQQNGRKARTVDPGLWDGNSWSGKGKKHDARVKGDKWWDPVRGGLADDVLPPNFSPGVMPVLKKLLLHSVKRRETSRAVLTRHAVHIKGVFGFDGSWGCGYRNAEMTIASLLMLPNSPYTSLFSGDGEPGIRAIQEWINEAWRERYDLPGRAQFKGEIMGTSKWIGPSDLYAMFSYLGVPCTIYDFPKPSDRPIPTKANPEPSYALLLRWVQQYFEADDSDLDEDGDANSDDLLRPTSPVRISDRLPLMLQHNGHSRTIVGYEVDLRGQVKLLLLDPGKTISKDVRDEGLQHLRRERAKVPSPQDDSDTPAAQGSKNKIREGAEAALPTSGDEVGPGGWVKRKISKPKPGNALSTSLSVFRMKPQREQKEFQVLAFPGTAMLPPEERAGRRKVTSVRITQ